MLVDSNQTVLQVRVDGVGLHAHGLLQRSFQPCQADIWTPA
jgi:hypothetical protein